MTGNYYPTMYKIFLALLGTAAVLAALAVVIHVSKDMRPPVKGGFATEALVDQIPPGGVVPVRVTRNKVREDCPLVAERYLVNDVGQKFDIPDWATSGGSASVESIVVRYRIPEHIPAGHYQLRVTLTYYCPGISVPFIYDQDPTEFTVKP